MENRKNDKYNILLKDILDISCALQNALDNLTLNFMCNYKYLRKKYNLLYEKNETIINTSHILQQHCKKICDFILIGDTIVDDIISEQKLAEKHYIEMYDQMKMNLINGINILHNYRNNFL